MPLPEAATANYRQVQRIQLVTIAALESAWSGMTQDFDSSWPGVERQVVPLVAAAQLASARAGASSVPRALEQQGVEVAALADVDPAAFAGVASDQRPLPSLLFGAVAHAKRRVAAGLPPGQALAAGGSWLTTAGRTQVNDANRGAASAAIAARPTVGWTRMVNPPCCSRCAILAGRFYRWNDGFRRHPGCDCTHVPCAETGVGEVATDVGRLFDEGLVTGLRRAQRDAIADGADPVALVNADRGRSQDGMYTSEGTSRRGVANQARRSAGLRSATARPTVDAIYARSATREEAVLLLRQNGYLRA